MRIAAFTGSKTISSRRFRVLQYIPWLAAQGVEVEEFVARFGSWPPPQLWKRPFWLAATIIDRFVPTVLSHRFDLTLLQREFVSTLFTLERFTGRPRVLDVDDAVWLANDRSRRSFASLVSCCDGVICGNDYIAQWVERFNANTIVIPTAVDTERFRPCRPHHSDRRIIGWSGLHAGLKYLLSIESALYDVLRSRPDVVLRIVSDVRPTFRLLNERMVEFIPWTPGNEVQTIQEMDIGLMPIDDTEWSKGKCSYKMLLYMACGVPVVVSPFGMNREVLMKGRIGLGPRTLDEWRSSIIHLLDNDRERQSMGEVARQIIENHYSLHVLAPRIFDYLRRFARKESGLT